MVLRRSVGLRAAATCLLATAIAGAIALTVEHHPHRTSIVRATPIEQLPAVTAFRDGGCRTVAEPVLALARLAQDAAGRDALPQPSRAKLVTLQDTLVAARTAVEAPLVSPLNDVITAIGFVRIRADGNTYRPALLTELNAARRELQDRCTTASPTATSGG